MATASAKSATKTLESVVDDHSQIKTVLLPYALAIVAQLPMLFLYFKGLWDRPHYQFFPFALAATAVLVFMRWPSKVRFIRSWTADLLMIVGLVFAIASALFVAPWFSSVGFVLVVTSLLARTYDQDTDQTLWVCAIPLFVCLVPPNNYDRLIITRLQAYSAAFTSQLLDLVGLGHHMDGTVIVVPGMKQYGVEEACSGVVSFFTLLAITSVFIVWSRRISVPNVYSATMLILVGLAIMVVEKLALGSLGYYALGGVALILMGCFGFRAAVLLMSAVFWALFMNTVRILLIPIADYSLGVDLSSGIAHDLLGYSVLAIGVLLILSTDQFLLFLFGPVEAAEENAGGINRTINRFWNSFLAGSNEESGENRRRRRRRSIRSVGRMDISVIWTLATVMLLIGLWQLVDVQRSLAQPQYSIRFFDADVTMDFEQGDMPELVENWKQVKYLNEDRRRGSDLGERSDIWQFQAPRCRPVASLDQTFPGWHELTTCYKNMGWKLRIDPASGREMRFRHDPEPAEGEQPWPYIEAEFEKDTGEKGYLLFSHFDAFGEPVAAPDNWGSFNSFVVRARNRLSHRIRANLFEGEVYQTQVFLQSFNDFDEDLKDEVKDRYLKIREHMREKFKEKRSTQSGV